jgi:integrase
LANRNITVREYFGALEVRQDEPAGRLSTGWLRALSASVKPRTRRLYATLGRLYILPALGHVMIRRMHRAHIKLFLSTLVEGKLKRASVKTILGVLNSMLSAAVEDGIILAHPGRGVAKKMTPARDVEEDDEIKPLSADELARLLAAAEESAPEYYPLFCLMALAGLRLGEVLALRWSSLDLVQREIRVSRTLAPSMRDLELADRLGSPKSGKARTVDMNVTLVGVLEAHERTARADALARGDGARLPELLFTTAAKGRPVDERKVRDVFARLLRIAKVSAHHTPHHLRHTFCALLLGEGVPVTYVMTQAGHSSIDVTVRYYGRWIPKSDRTLIDRINARLAPAQAALAAAIGGSSQSVSNPGIIPVFGGLFEANALHVG